MNKEQLELMQEIWERLPLSERQVTEDMLQGEGFKILDEGWCLRWLLGNDIDVDLSYARGKCKYEVVLHPESSSRIIELNDNLLTALLQLVLQVMKEG